MRMIVHSFSKGNTEDKELWCDRPGGWAQVYLRSGRIQVVNWLGFIDVQLARRTPDARPVKIKARACNTGAGLHNQWRHLDPEEAVLGCLFNGGVFAVLEKGEFRVVSRSELMQAPKGRK